MAILFENFTDLKNFKRESVCNDFYIKNDFRTLVGIFPEPELLLAKNKFNARVTLFSDTY